MSYERCERTLSHFLVFVLFTTGGSHADERIQRQRELVSTTMKKAVTYFHGKLAVNGGYVYHYTEDLKTRWGEGLATPTQIWVQPPATPTVGMAFVKAYNATGDEAYLDVAEKAANALLYGQLKSGGWRNAIDFDSKSKQTAEYRNGKGSGSNVSSLDDGQTQSAIRFLIQIDAARQFNDKKIHEATEFIKHGVTAIIRHLYERLKAHQRFERLGEHPSNVCIRARCVEAIGTAPADAFEQAVLGRASVVGGHGRNIWRWGESGST